MSRSPAYRAHLSLAIALAIATAVQARAQPAEVASPVEAGDCAESKPSRTKLGFCDTIAESMFGKTDPDAWRPLPFATFFSEGWDEPWVPSPRGSGGAPRQ